MPNKNEVGMAFEILLEEVESVVDSFNQDAEMAFKNRDYQKAKALIEDATILADFREKIKTLQKEWQRLFASKIPKTKIVYKKLKKGLRTPEDEYRIPILESIQELGGKAPMREVLSKVYEKMKNKLNDYDLSPLPSNPEQKRWENGVQWCRNTLVREGLLSPESPKGTWEITAIGMAEIKKNLETTI